MNKEKAIASIKTYISGSFTSDLKAGLITAIVALPLALAFAIASGVPPVLGLYTAIIAGIIGSIAGGSNFSITGPTGAMTVVILSTVHKFGLEGLLVAGFLAGVMQIALGAARLGKVVKFIPFPIVSGFTAGIGLLIFMGQVPNFFGLSIPAQDHIWQTLYQIGMHFAQTNLMSIAIATITFIILLYLPKLLRFNSHLSAIPASLFALLLTTITVWFFGWSVPLVGDIPQGLMQFSFFNISWDMIHAVLPAAFTIAMLGSIEALLCAVVSDGMTGTKHNSDRELIGQGAANIVLPFFGTIPSTAAIARTAVNIREGAKTRWAGVIHAIILLVIMLALAPLAALIPKAFLAGVLMYVSLRMINIHEFVTIFHISKLESGVFLVTFALTFLTDLVFAVEVGLAMAIFLLFIRMSQMLELKTLVEHDPNDEDYMNLKADERLSKKVDIYTMNGPFFFGAMSMFDERVDRYVPQTHKHIILRMSQVPLIDTSAIVRLNEFIKDRNKFGYHVYLVGLTPFVKQKLGQNAEFVKMSEKNVMFSTTKQAMNHIAKSLA